MKNQPSYPTFQPKVSYEKPKGSYPVELENRKRETIQLGAANVFDSSSPVASQNDYLEDSSSSSATSEGMDYADNYKFADRPTSGDSRRHLGEGSKNSKDDKFRDRNKIREVIGKTIIEDDLDQAA